MNPDEVDEQELWENLTPQAWHNSVAEKGSVFHDTYHETRKQIREAAVTGQHDVIIEVGCGTGDIIGRLDDSSEIDQKTRDGLADIDRYGLDINPDFLRFAKTNHNELNRVEFLLQDVTKMVPEWWLENGYDKKYKKPLVVCVNNTLNIMPEELRGATVAQMLAIAGDDGHCLVSYWNGNFFSHAIMNYYKRNPKLCGSFDLNTHVNWDERKLVSSTGYSTTWHTVEEVQNILRAHDVDVDMVHDVHKPTYDHMNLGGLAIFAWFSNKCTSRAKEYYDSDDAQKFYNGIWSDSMTHIGRYDLLTEEEKSSLSLHKQIFKAQEHHEAEFVKLIKSKFEDQQVRVLDMGCGYGGLLRLLWKEGVVWSAVGCDISHKMCQQARQLNEDLSTACDRDITILEESYLDVNVPDCSADLVISMDALLHVGPEGQRKAIKEAARILRPGGYMIFSDIMQQEEVDPEEMKPIYDRINLSKMGTVSNYKDAMENVGFRKFEFLQANSTNVSQHYGSVRKVLEQIGDELEISQEYQQKMKSGLQTWETLATKNIVWGFTVAQKLVKVDLPRD